MYVCVSINVNQFLGPLEFQAITPISTLTDLIFKSTSSVAMSYKGLYCLFKNHWILYILTNRESLAQTARMHDSLGLLCLHVA